MDSFHEKQPEWASVETEIKQKKKKQMKPITYCLTNPVHSFLLKYNDEKFTPDLMFTKYEANLPAKGIGREVSQPV